MTRPVSIGVSSCLCGEKVRYDGGHKHDRYITDVLGSLFRLVPLCPEVACGMPVPREAMRLEGDPAAPRLVTIETRLDRTDMMREFCRSAMPELAQAGLCGFVLKKNSPSCGLGGIKVYTAGTPDGEGRGLFAAAVSEHFPLLPLEDEAGLSDPQARDRFIKRVFAYQRWQESRRARPAPGEP